MTGHTEPQRLADEINAALGRLGMGETACAMTECTGAVSIGPADPQPGAGYLTAYVWENEPVEWNGDETGTGRPGFWNMTVARVPGRARNPDGTVNVQTETGPRLRLEPVRGVLPAAAMVAATAAGLYAAALAAHANETYPRDAVHWAHEVINATRPDAGLLRQRLARAYARAGQLTRSQIERAARDALAIARLTGMPLSAVRARAYADAEDMAFPDEID